MRTMTSEPKMKYVLLRFALKLALLSVFAVSRSFPTGGAGKVLATLTLFSGVVDSGLALYHREDPFAMRLTYWDEAAAFVALSIVIRWLY